MSPHHKVRIEDDGSWNRKLWIDDHRIENAVASVNVVIEAGEMTEIEIRLALVENTQVLGKARVYLDGSQKELLELLGWTPPRGS
jgi:hypothetical protein